ncbi:MAG: ParA family protein [Pseudomonadota bacterium]
MKTLSIITQKGGAGKTTIATALAVAAELDGKSVAIFDLDPQATACFWSDVREAPTPAVKDCSVARLPNYLAAAKEAGCDLAVIDCPAVHRDIAHDAAALSDLVLIPTRADVFDVRSMTKTIEVVKSVSKPYAVVLNFCPPSGPEVPAAREGVTDIGAELCPVELHQLKAFSRAQQTGQTAQEVAAGSGAAEQIEKLYAYTRIKLYDEEIHGSKQTQSTRRSA